MGWGNQKPWLGKRVNWGDPITKNLAGCWLFNEGTGAGVENLASINGRSNGVNKGLTTWSPLPGRDMGLLSNVGEGNGLHGFDLGAITSGNPLSCYATQELSIACGALPTDGTSEAMIFAKESGINGVNGYHMEYVGDSGIDSYQMTNRAGATYMRVNFSAPAGFYHDVVLTAKGGTKDGFIYVNGIDQNAPVVGINFGFPATTTNAAIIDYPGDWGFDRKFVGSLFYLYIWDRILSLSEANRIHDDNFCFIEDPLSDLLVSVISSTFLLKNPANLHGNTHLLRGNMQ